MRTPSHLIVLSTVVTLGMTLSAPAAGQAGARYPRPDIGGPAPVRAAQPVVSTSTIGTPPVRAARWGSRVDGRWWGGANAPGGWAAYRRPARGTALPKYWNDRRFAVNDWATYPLPQPPVGYRWSRYYDDAILIDQRGTVYDSVPNIDWDRSGAGYPQPPLRRDSGLGGAAIGAVAGGVAGNVIAGQGNRLGGTLIDAGVGAAAGYAIDRAEDRQRRMPPGHDDYGQSGYREPGYGQPAYGYPDDYAPPPPPPALGRRVVTRDGTTVTTTTTVGTLASGQPGYYDGGYYYPAPTTTTVVVQGTPVTTTTTTTTTEAVGPQPRRRRARGRTPRR